MNLRKLNLGLVALVLGFGLVITQSAFSPKSNPQNHQYGKTSTGEWIELDEERYECDFSDDICTGTFSYTNPLPGADPDVSVDQENASYVLKMK